jgi:hypothetical protein
MIGKKAPEAILPEREKKPLTMADMARAAEGESVRTQEMPPQATMPPAGNNQPAPLFPTSDIEQFKNRWMDVQTGFVDEPRSAVESADTLVAEVIKRLAVTFADERSKLEQQWTRGENVSTEDLRIAMQRYRSFFDRLLSL